MSRLLERLRKYQDNRGMMANLKCILVPAKKHRAWPILSRIGVKLTKEDEVSAIVAGLYAMHPAETQEGNMGNTCKNIEWQKGESRGEESKISPTERRFQHLLAAEKGNELYERIIRMILLAKSMSIAVNYERLEIDLKFWNDRTKTEWAASFWAPEVDSTLIESSEGE
jgi:CRISPR system Cascade subunit CasB